jgi:uncharacterized membrane protein (UPF0127 family)
MKKLQNTILISVLGISSQLAFAANKTPPLSTVSIDHTTYHVIVVNTEATREQGLSGRKKLDPDQGMFFIFDKQAKYSFWMKDMNFPIDIIFINDHKIVTIFNSVPAPTSGTKLSQLPLYTATAPANYVLEVNAGEAAKHHFKLSDKVVMRGIVVGE